MTNPGDESTPEQPGGTPAQPPTPPGPAEPEAPATGLPAAPPPPEAAPTGLPPAPPAPADGYAAFPASSAPGGAPVAAPTAPPNTVNIAFWLFVAGAVLSVVSGIITIFSVSSQHDSLASALQNSGQLHGQDASAAANAFIVGAIVWSIITLIFWALTFVLFAFFMRRGANWARIVLTILAVLSLLNIAIGFGVGALQVVAAVVAVVLLWLRPSSEYFAAVKAAKAPRA